MPGCEGAFANDLGARSSSPQPRVWIGCIATETVFEHTTGREPGLAAAVAALHVKIDLWVEVPAFVLVLMTGAAMLPRTQISPMLLAKIAIGLVAVGANATCVWIVFPRNRAIVREDLDRAAWLNHWQHKAGELLVTLIALTITLAVVVRL